MQTALDKWEGDKIAKWSDVNKQLKKTTANKRKEDNLEGRFVQPPGGKKRKLCYEVMKEDWGQVGAGKVVCIPAIPYIPAYVPLPQRDKGRLRGKGPRPVDLPTTQRRLDRQVKIWKYFQNGPRGLKRDSPDSHTVSETSPDAFASLENDKWKETELACEDT